MNTRKWWRLRRKARQIVITDHESPEPEPEPELLPNAAHHDAGERWDESDDETLIKFVRQALSNDEIATRLGRTKKAIASRKYVLRKRGDL